MKVGIYSPATPLPSLVGNGYIIYLATDSDGSNGTATAEGTTHGNSWIFAIAVLLPEHVLGQNAPRILSLEV
jgi:hypothetical protein